MARDVDTCAFSFSDVPEDVQLCILSFLSPGEITSFACTSKRFASLCREDAKLWHAMCDRRWGKKTQIRKWGDGKISYRFLYKTLSEWENLIGFWRRCGQANPVAMSPPLVLFEWGSSSVLGSRVLPTGNGTYHVMKTPFLLMCISRNGRIVNSLNLDGDFGSATDFDELGFSDSNLVQVDVNFMGNEHVLVEENRFFAYNLRDEKKSPVSKSSSSGDESDESITGRSPESLVSEMYMQFANRTSPGGDRRRQRRKGKERTKWEPEHFVKVVNCSPTPTKPLQGLWKGFREGMDLEFYLVKYDEIGGIICRRVGDLSSPRHTAPVFWTSNLSFIEAPFSLEEEQIFDGRLHLTPLTTLDHIKAVSRMLYINSSYDLVLPGLVANGSGPPRGEGRIWMYENGTFGFGFLQDQFIIDLKRVVEDGCLADELKASSQ